MVQDHVVRLGGAAGPNDVEGLATEQGGEFFRAPASAMAARVPIWCMDDGLPPSFSVTCNQASRASRITGAVAL